LPGSCGATRNHCSSVKIRRSIASSIMEDVNQPSLARDFPLQLNVNRP
jgi:hypothetical protein